MFSGYQATRHPHRRRGGRCRSLEQGVTGKDPLGHGHGEGDFAADFSIKLPRSSEGRLPTVPTFSERSGYFSRYSPSFLIFFWMPFGRSLWKSGACAGKMSGTRTLYRLTVTSLADFMPRQLHPLKIPMALSPRHGHPPRPQEAERIKRDSYVGSPAGKGRGQKPPHQPPVHHNIPAHPSSRGWKAAQAQLQP